MSQVTSGSTLAANVNELASTVGQAVRGHETRLSSLEENGVPPQISQRVAALEASQAVQDTAIQDAAREATAAKNTANTAKDTADAALPKAGGTMAGPITIGGKQLTGSNGKLTYGGKELLTKANEGLVTLKGTRTTAGDMTLTGLTIGKPLYIGLANKSPGHAHVMVKSGSLIGLSETAINDYLLGRYNDIATPMGTVIIPTNTTVVLCFASITPGSTVYVYQ